MLFCRVFYSPSFNEVGEFSTPKSRTHPSSCSGSVVPRATKYRTYTFGQQNRLSEQWGGSALGGSWIGSWDSSSYRIGSRSSLPPSSRYFDGCAAAYFWHWQLQTILPRMENAVFVPIHVFIFVSATRKKIPRTGHRRIWPFMSQGRSLATSFPTPLNFETKLIVSLICCDAGGEEGRKERSSVLWSKKSAWIHRRKRN